MNLALGVEGGVVWGGESGHMNAVSAGTVEDIHGEGGYNGV